MRTREQDDRQIAIWLFLVCAAILFMLVLGGATRLTHSGLSMVQWDPLMGWIPPLSDAQWAESFRHYQQTPEFYKLNAGMDLPGYQQIFLLEYVHRVWGRLIGVIFLLPFLYFLIRGRIKPALRPKLIFMFILGGLQGVLGWYMVKSGLVDRPHVSQYRLTAHLLAAFILYGYIFWQALGLFFSRTASPVTRLTGLRRYTWLITGLVFTTAASGGFVAGLKAGFAFNTFPLMGGRLIPEYYLSYQPWYRNLFENIAAVQFDHRLLAELTILLIVGLYFYCRRLQLDRFIVTALRLLLLAVIGQFSLGVSTLLLVVPTTLAVIHQGGALLLFTAALFLAFAVGNSRPAS